MQCYCSITKPLGTLKSSYISRLQPAVKYPVNHTTLLPSLQSGSALATRQRDFNACGHAFAMGSRIGLTVALAELLSPNASTAFREQTRTNTMYSNINIY